MIIKQNSHLGLYWENNTLSFVESTGKSARSVFNFTLTDAETASKGSSSSEILSDFVLGRK